MYDYIKLKARIMEKFRTQEDFAKAMGMSLPALNQRLNGAVSWRSPEMAKACELLGIDMPDMWIYFFTEKV